MVRFIWNNAQSICNGDGTMNRLAILMPAFAACIRCVFGYGPWLEWTPLGGVELDDSGLARAALEQRLA